MGSIIMGTLGCRVYITPTTYLRNVLFSGWPKIILRAIVCNRMKERGVIGIPPQSRKNNYTDPAMGQKHVTLHQLL